MNQLNSCIFEGTMTDLNLSPAGASFKLESYRIRKVNGKNIKEITNIPVFIAQCILNDIERQKPIRELEGSTVRVVGRMSSFETNGVLRLLCIAEHIDVKR